jgi:hypothetical protein
LKVRPWACHGYGTTVCLPEADTEWAINQPQSAWTTKSEVCFHAHQPLRLPGLEGLGERRLVCTLPIPACRIGNIHASPMGGQANSDIHSCAYTQEKCNQQAPVPELPYVIWVARHYARHAQVHVISAQQQETRWCSIQATTPMVRCTTAAVAGMACGAL